MKGSIKMLIAMIILAAAIPIAFAGNIENNEFFIKETSTPLTNVEGLTFTCTDSSCANVVGGAWFSQNSGATNILSIEYPGAASMTYYAQYFYVPGYLPWEGVAWDYGNGNTYNYDTYLEKAEGCHSPVDSLGITNTIYANEPMVVNYQALVDSTVSSAFFLTSAPPYYVPSGYDDYYSALTDVTLTVYDPSDNVVHTETKQINLFADTQQEVVFDWTPANAGEGYRATVSTDVVDDQCSSSVPQSASKEFDVLPSRPQDECYTLMNNLDISNEFPIINETITLTYEKISNYAANDYSKTATTTDVTYTVRAGQSNPSGSVVYTNTQTIAATSTTDFTEFNFDWTAPDTEGWYTVYVTGISNDALCSGKGNHDETLEIEVYVAPEPTVTVSFEISDNDNGLPLAGVTVSMDGKTDITDADGKAEITDVAATTTQSYTLNLAGYNTVSGSEYIPEVDWWIYRSMTRTNNTAPQFTTTPVTEACQNQLYTYDADAVDPENDPVTYSMTAGPTGATIDANTGLLSFTPTSMGNSVVVLSASDDHNGYNEQQFSVSVRDCSPNTAPQITTTAPTDFVCLGDTFTYDVDATDAEADTPVFSLTTAPNTMSIDSMTGVITWVADSVGHNAVTARAGDGRDSLNLFDQEPFTVTVVDCSQPLNASANDATCFANETIYVSGSATGGLAPYSYAWDLNNDGTYESAEFSPAFTCPADATVGTQYTANFRVTDDVSQTDTDSAVITVVEFDGPTIITTPVTFAYPNEQYEYDVEARDPDGDAITYTLNQASLDRGMTINPTNGLIKWTPANSDSGNTYTVTVTATSVDGSDSQTYTLSVVDREDDFGFYVNNLYVSTRVATGEYAMPGDTMQLLFRLSNEGDNEFENVQIMAYVDSLSMYSVEGPVDLDSGEEVDKRVYLNVPESAGEGVHYIRVIVSSNMGWREVYREFTIRE